MKTQWKLLKDLPGAPAGTISTKDSTDEYAYFGPPEDSYIVQHYVPFMRLHPDWFQEIKPLKIMRLHPDWFQEIKPLKIMVIECEFEPVEPESDPVPVAVVWRTGTEENTWLGSRPQPNSRVLSYRVEER